MIVRATGEIFFLDGLSFTPHVVLTGDHLRDAITHRALSLPGWTQHVLGVHPSDHGDFEVEAVSDPSCHIHTVFLAHSHPFYERNTPEDAERRALHEGVIAADLAGQSDFSWGEVFCRLDPEANRDWLVVKYTPGPWVPLRAPEIPRQLKAMEIVPESPSRSHDPLSE